MVNEKKIMIHVVAFALQTKKSLHTSAQFEPDSYTCMIGEG